MSKINIQIVQDSKKIDFSWFVNILKGNGIDVEIITTNIFSSDYAHKIGKISFLNTATNFPYRPEAQIFIHHASEFFWPVNSDFEIISLIKNGNTKNNNDLITQDLKNALVVVKRKNDDNINTIILKRHDLRKKLGKVFLVGAGTGKLDMLTLKAIELIHTADIVFYDNLVSNDIIDEIKKEKVYVGKRAGDHSKTQKEINELLFEAAIQNKKIVRLKGGDPTVFGHAGEEIAFLESTFIEVEIIPGISSVLAASSISKTPLTLRGLGKSVAFCSGHEKTNIKVPDVDTIVYLMGAHNLKRICKALLNHGYKVNTPIKLVYNIGALNQEIFDETIESVLKKENNYKPPIITIVGQVADKANWWNAFIEKKRILYTGTHIDKYTDLGYVTHHPMIKIVPMPDTTEIDSTVVELDTFDIIIFTSIYAVRYYFERIYAMGFDTRRLTGLQVVAIGMHTSSELKRNGIVPDLLPREESSEGIIKLLETKSLKNKNILLPRSDKSLPYLPNQLLKLGFKVKNIKVYTNVIPENINKVNPENFDQVIFSSPSCVENFIKYYGNLPETPELIAKGKETMKAIKKHR